MKKMMMCCAVLASLCTTIGLAQAEQEAPLKHVDIRMDQTTLKAGLSVFTDVCMGCHSLRYMTWKNLMDYPEIGLTREEVDDLRGDAPLNARMMTELSEADAKENYGTVPPDLSLIVRAREGHGDYIYSLLTGFEHDPKGRIDDGNYNIYFPGHHIAMSDPLGWLDHEPEDEKDLKQQARAVVSFLSFVSDPHQLERQAIGKWVIIFLIVFTFILWLLKRSVWEDVEHELR
jgi:cytochrome c1